MNNWKLEIGEKIMNSRRRRKLEAERHNRLLAKNKAKRIEQAERTLTKKENKQNTASDVTRYLKYINNMEEG